MSAIAVTGLTKAYDRLEALRGVNLTVPEGVVFGLVGPNGAGKSTLIKALVGALRPTSGSVRVLDLDPLGDRAKLHRQMGYMPQAPALYADLSARANIAFFARAHDMPDFERRIMDVLELTELADRATEPVHAFSGGMQRRVSLACALVHRPRLLFLDEPTAAVDPALRARFWKTFRTIAAGGATLFISTHLMDEAMLCDTVAILRQGQIIACDAPHALLERGRTRLRVWQDGKPEEASIGGRPEDLAAALHSYGLPSTIRAVEVYPDSLEAVILRIVGAEGTS